MDRSDSRERSYWRLLADAEAALDAGDFAAAERAYDLAVDRRGASPGRVFLTEKLGDALGRLVRRRTADAPGRWQRRETAFVGRFRQEGETQVRAGVRLAELRPEDNATTNQPVLAAALHLVARSRLFPEEPSSAVALLKGLFRTAHRTGQPFDPQLLRHDLPLTEEDRLWLARKGADVIEGFLDQGGVAPGTEAAAEWADAVLSFLDPRSFAAGERLEEERAWLEAVTADRLLGRAEASVGLYRAYLDLDGSPAPRTDEARVRLLEILGNLDGDHFPVPRYDEAFSALRTAGLAPDSAAADRYARALARLEHRRPDLGAQEERTWASAAGDGRGGLVFVLWWRDEPRDLARWGSARDTEALAEFLTACSERIVAADGGAAAALPAALRFGPAPWSVRGFAEVLVEAEMPREGATREALAALAAAETGPWRTGWREELGQPRLAPEMAALGSGGVGEALLAGLVWLALRSRVAAADPALRAGIGCLAGRGDPASVFLYRHLVLDDDAGKAVDETFSPWTLPLLWTRPDPFAGRGPTGPAAAEDVRPDLGRNALALVSTGRPSAALAAWGEGRHRWRVVIDRLDRLAEVAVAAPTAAGLATLVPPGGRVHDLAAALELLEEMLPGGAQEPAPEDGLLPLCHWQRLVTTHNGDLLDLASLRPWLPGAFPVLDRYAEIVSGLPRQAPRLDDGGAADWAAQFAQRARRAGCVCGLADDLPLEDARLDATWGVFEGSGGAWAFLDSAAVHLRLAAAEGPQPQVWHARLHARGDRHLSVLTGAIFARAEVEARLARWLAVFGPAHTLALTDLSPPRLLLADRGVAPTARRLAATALAAAMQHVRRPAREGSVRVVEPPRGGTGADFWRECAGGFLADDARCRLLTPAEPAGDGASGEILTLPVLPGLDLPAPERPGSSGAEWRARDVAREELLAEARSACSLELAARLAGRWEAVEVLDPRWWTLLPATALREEPWTGEKALAALAPAGARCFDLPGAAPGAAPAAPPEMVDEIRRWLVERPDGAPPDGGEGEVRPGRHLEVGAGEASRTSLLAAVETAWEAGHVGTWLLCAAVGPWHAGATAGGTLARGQSVWTPQASFAPGPVLWACPEDLLDPTFAAAVAVRPPLAVLVPELAEWLPGGDGDARSAAVALRAVLALPATGIFLQAESLDEPWVRYLVAAADVQVLHAEVARAENAAVVERAPQPPATVIARLQCLLAGLAPLLERRRNATGDMAGDQLASARELVSLAHLGALAGLPEPTVRRGLETIRWAAGLAGDNLSAAADEAGREPHAAGHALLIKRRFAELENELNRLGEAVDLLLSLWLSGLRSGTAARVDLAEPPAEMPSDLLRRADTFLLGADPAVTRLDYRAPYGVLGANRRELVLDGPAAEVRAAVKGALDLFGRRLRDVMGSAVETGAGFLVETGLDELRTDEEAFLGLGAALEDWRWLGPGGADAVHVIDLLTLADSPTARARGAAWQLVGELLGTPASAPAETRQRPRPRAPGRWWARLAGDRQRDAVTAAAERVAAVAGVSGEESLLVLSGPAGSGRCASVLAGLADSLRRADDPGPVTVVCPDTASAARWHRRALQLGLALDVRIPGADLPPPDAAPAAWAPSATRDVVVLAEAQRFAPEDRYRAAQAGRGRRLVMTVDPAASDEPWENLFLTTPRASAVVRLTGQHEQARRLWSEVRGLCDTDGVATGGASRAEKGQIATEYAANLDQCLARIQQARNDGFLPDEIRLTAPLAEDVAFLGNGLRERGWQAMDEERLDALFLPGTCELLAAASDVLAADGFLGRALELRTAEADSEAPDDAHRNTDELRLLPRLPGAAPVAAEWPGEPWDAERRTLGDVWLAFAPRHDLAASVADPAARLRAERLVAGRGDQTLRDLAADPLWQTWWRLLAEDLGLAVPPSGRPRVLLAPASRIPGGTARGAVHLCLGTEDPRLLYRVLSRAADSLLVLYQERSPLNGDEGS